MHSLAAVIIVTYLIVLFLSVAHEQTKIEHLLIVPAYVITLVGLPLWLAFYLGSLIFLRREPEYERILFISMIFSLSLSSILLVFNGDSLGEKLIKTEMSTSSREKADITISPSPLQLSGPDRLRVEQIINNTRNDAGFLTHRTYEEFWDILKKYHFDKDEKEKLKVRTVGETVFYRTALYQDAQTSLRMGIPFKSVARTEYERELLALGVIDAARIKQYDKCIEQIALRKPGRIEDKSIIPDENHIDSIISANTQIKNRIEKLFNRYSHWQVE
jgi:hypothetical protein